jgi:hypothetical protein
MTRTRGLRYLGAAALLKQRVALVRIEEGEGVNVHAGQPANLNDLPVRIAVAKRRIWRHMVNDLASMKSPQRTPRPQMRAKPEIDIELQDDGRGGNRKTPMSDPAGKLPEATQRAE